MKTKTMESKIKVLEHAFAESFGAYYSIDLTRDLVPGTMYQVIDGREYSINEKIGMPENARFSDVVRYWSAQVPEAEKKAYFDTLNVSNLLRRYGEGERHVSIQYWTKTALFEPMLAEQHVVMYPDEETGDVLAISYVLDRTEAHRDEEARNELKAHNEELQKLLAVEKQCSGLLFALGKIYWQIYSVDLSAKKYYAISASEDGSRLEYKAGFAPEVFSNSLQRFVSEEDKQTMTEFLNHATLPERLAERDYISQEYLSTIGAWFNASYIVQKRDETGRASSVLFTLQNVTAKVQRDLERQHQEKMLNKQLLAGNRKLEEQVHIISGLANAYFAVHRVDLRTNRGKAIKEVEAFGKANRSGETTEADARAFIERCVMPEDRDKMRAFAEWQTLPQRLEHTDTLVQEYHSAIAPWTWCRASWIVADRDEEGHAVDVLFAVEDVTEAVSQRKQLEAERDRELLAAEAANQAKSTFLFNMSHDIRTPMNAILGYSALAAKNTDVPENVRDYLKKIQISGQGMLAILDNVLELSRIESGKAVLEKTAQAAGSVLDACMVMMEPEIEKRHHTVSVSKQVTHPYIYFDATHLTEILLNVLSNAVKYTANGGTVRCCLTQRPGGKPGWVDHEISVADNGIGMSEAFLGHIFESFAREHSTTDSGIPGTGLGMGIVKKLVDLMEGDISIQSRIGEGTTVTIRIPCRVAAYEDTQPKRSAESGSRERLAGKRILLAEDNDLNAEIAATLLAEEGVLVERAENGVECVEMLDRKPDGYYDLVLMDIQMPVMDGYMATQKIRRLSDPVKANIPIVAMTANAFTEDKLKAMQMGMNDHVAKPIDMNILTGTMLKYLL